MEVLKDFPRKRSDVPGPFALKSYNFDAPSTRYGVVQFIYSVKDTTDYDWETSEEVPAFEVNVAAYYIEYPGEDCERVGQTSHNYVKAATVKAALASIIASWYL
jgi:hypothetical protein